MENIYSQGTAQWRKWLTFWINKLKADVEALETDLTTVNQEITNLQANSEVESNKSQDIELDKLSEDKYPSAKAVVDYVTSIIVDSLSGLVDANY